MEVLLDTNRRTIRAEYDPTDKSTVVSIYPGEVVQNHWTTQPGMYRVAPGSFENPAVLTVESSSWWKETGQDEPIIEVSHRSVTVARSIVVDWCNGLIEYNGQDCMPGLFFVQGSFTSKEIKDKFKIELVNAKTKQNTWYRALIKRADSFWARSNGNPSAIADLMKIAAKELGQDRPWLKDFQLEQFENCKACGSMKPISAVVCITCKAITDPKRAEELGIVFAK